MMIVRIYHAMSEIVVEITATVMINPVGMPQEPQAIFVGREYLDGTSSINPEDLGEAVYAVLERANQGLGEEFGGLTMVC